MGEGNGKQADILEISKLLRKILGKYLILGKS